MRSPFWLQALGRFPNKESKVIYLRRNETIISTQELFSLLSAANNATGPYLNDMVALLDRYIYDHPAQERLCQWVPIATDIPFYSLEPTHSAAPNPLTPIFAFRSTNQCTAKRKEPSRPASHSKRHRGNISPSPPEATEEINNKEVKSIAEIIPEDPPIHTLIASLADQVAALARIVKSLQEELASTKAELLTTISARPSPVWQTALLDRPTPNQVPHLQSQPVPPR